MLVDIIKKNEFSKQTSVTDIKNSSFCGKSHKPRKCLAFGKACSKGGKKKLHQYLCRIRNKAYALSGDKFESEADVTNDENECI